MLRAQYIPVSRLHLSRSVIGSSKNAPRAALAGKRAGCRPGRASPRGTHGTCSTNTQLKSIAFAITRWSHTHCGRASTLETLARRSSRRAGSSRLALDARNTHNAYCGFFKDYNVRESGKALGVQGALEAKSPDPLHERATRLSPLQPDRTAFQRGERERESHV
jgi:hypothetical protein